MLLADDYAKRMAPVTYSLPHSLIPVANVALIEYALELLVSAGVAQVFVVVSDHAEVVQEYLNKSHSCEQFASVEVVVAPGCKSEGQALREVDSRDKIRGDFILCSVDMVAHLKLQPALEAHKRRREAEKNKDAIVTMIMRPSAPAERKAIYDEEDLIVAVAPDSQRLVHYQSMTAKGLSMDVVGPIYTYVHIHTCVYIHTHMYTCTYVCIHTYIHYIHTYNIHTYMLCTYINKGGT